MLGNNPIHLGDFYVSEKTGFLLEEPLELLPPYFEIWNFLAKSAPTLLATHLLRDQVDKMPLLDSGRLIGHRQQRLAHLQLSVLGAGYVWQEGEDGVPQKLPACLATPWCQVSESLGLQPILCHPSFALANWKLVDPDRPAEVENVTPLYELPGGMACRWFCAVTCMVEMTFAKALQPIQTALAAVSRADLDTVTQSLDQVAATVSEMEKDLSRMHDNLPAEVFFNSLRPYLSGWGGKDNPLPQGLVYEGFSEFPKQCIGGSAAQSATLQLLDAFLGVQHSPDKVEFLQQMLHYMLPDHRRLVETTRNHPHQLHRLVETQNDSNLTSAYKRCLAAVVAFRNYHIQIVTKYVIIPASQKNRNKEFKSLETKGTGGSNLLPFLKDLREKTVAAMFK